LFSFYYFSSFIIETKVLPFNCAEKGEFPKG